MKLRSQLSVMFYETIGSFLIAVGIYNFAVLSEFPMTGFSGIAIILYRLFDFPIGLTTIVLNIPVAILCYRVLGRGFFLRSLRCIVISSIMIDVVAPYLPMYQGDRLLSAICAGVLGGLGYALIFMQNSSTGGTDFIIMAVKAKKPHLSLGKISFILDVGIVLAGGLIFEDVDGIIYGMMISYLFAVVIDKVMYGINSGKMTLIVTTRGREVVEIIEKTIGRGSTILKGYGGHKNNEEKSVVMCACNNKQMYVLEKAVEATDEAAFIIILESNEVYGEGFKMIAGGEKRE